MRVLWFCTHTNCVERKTRLCKEQLRVERDVKLHWRTVYDNMTVWPHPITMTITHSQLTNDCDWAGYSSPAAQQLLLLLLLLRLLGNAARIGSPAVTTCKQPVPGCRSLSLSLSVCLSEVHRLVGWAAPLSCGRSEAASRRRRWRWRSCRCEEVLRYCRAAATASRPAEACRPARCWRHLPAASRGRKQCQIRGFIRALLIT